MIIIANANQILNSQRIHKSIVKLIVDRNLIRLIRMNVNVSKGIHSFLHQQMSVKLIVLITLQDSIL